MREVIGALVVLVGATGCFKETSVAGSQTSGDETGDTSTSTSTSSPTTTSSNTSATATSTSTTSVDTGTGDSTGGDTGSPACPGGGQCVPSVPTNWNGPILVQESSPGDAEPPCPEGSMPDPLMVGTGLMADPAVCPSCACMQPEGCPATAYAFTAENCFGQNQSIDLDSATCTDLPTGVSFRVDSLPMACAVIDRGEPELPSPRWQSVAFACRPDLPVDCTAGFDGLCVPDSGSHRACVWRDEENPCPAQWSQELVYYRSWNDSRDCTACDCGYPVGLDCEGSVTFATTNSCSIVGQEHQEGQCYTPPNTIPEYVEYVPNDDVGTCEASGGEPNGDVVPVDPVTLCCLP